MTDRDIKTDTMSEAQLAAATCDDPIEKLAQVEAQNEELIRGMTEMGQRFTIAMDGAAKTIDAQRAALEQISQLDKHGGYNSACHIARKALGS